MPALISTSLTSVGTNVTNVNTLTASDTFVYDSTRNQVLQLRNSTAGALTVSMVGNTATTVAVAGIGNVTVSTGFGTGAIAATTGITTIALNTVSAFLTGSLVTVTGGTGISAVLYSL